MTGMIQIALAIYRTYGRDAAKRFLTPPRKAIEAICAKTGADISKAIEERDEATEQTLQFIESLVDADFVDPD